MAYETEEIGNDLMLVENFRRAMECGSLLSLLAARWTAMASGMHPTAAETTIRSLSFVSEGGSKLRLGYSRKPKAGAS